MKKTLPILISLLLLPYSLLAAPMDFDADNLSNPSSVISNNNNELRWVSQLAGNSVNIATSFGLLGNHLAVASYLGSYTNLATINYAGVWSIADGLPPARTFTHGAINALYLSGGDFDGDGLADAAYATNVCEAKRSISYFKINPLTETPLEINFPTAKGYFYKTFIDTNNDQRDELCWSAPIKSNNRFTGRFRLICRDAITKQQTLKINLKKLYEAPLPVRNQNGADYILTYRPVGNATQLIILNTAGKTVKKVTIQATGNIVIGQFQTGTVEQIAVVGVNNRAKIYNLETNEISTVSFPDGIAFDEININYFSSASYSPTCFCNSTTIAANNGKCQSTSPVIIDTPNNPGTSPTPTPTPIYTGDNDCDYNRVVNDGNEGFLHKPVSESNGKIANLTKTSDYPATCRYEYPNGSLFRSAYLSSFSNPDRPTWRPSSGGGCSEYPDNLIFACQIKGKKHCWNIPDPCKRYD